MINSDLDKAVMEMKNMADMMVQYTFPVATVQSENDTALLRQRTMVVDGYELVVCLSKADYGDHFMYSLRIQSTMVPFVPFVVVCKLGRAFLGDRNLSYVEFFVSNRKLYCWMLKTKNGVPMPPDEDDIPSSYEGFAFSILRPGAVELF